MTKNIIYNGCEILLIRLSRMKKNSVFFSMLLIGVAIQNFSGILYARVQLTSSTDRRIIKLELEPAKIGPFHYRKPVQSKVGIALSGGGLRGFAQIGVLDEFEKAGIPIDYIAGTSMGAIVGGLYSIGYSPKDIEQFVTETDWSNIYSNTPERSTMFIGQKQDLNRHLLAIRFDNYKPYIPLAISQGQQIFSLLNPLILRAISFQDVNFDNFRVPLRIVATEIWTGKQKTFKEGDLALIILGSIAIPFLFSEVKIGDEVYIDGGILNNMPTDVVKSMGSDFVIAIDCTSPLLEPEEVNFPWQLVDHITTIMQREKNEERLALADIVITPDLGDREAFDFEIIDEFIELGRQKAREIIPEIKKKLLENSNILDSAEPFTVDKIEISGNNSIGNDYIRQYISSTESEKTSDKTIKEDLIRIFETGYFEDVQALIKQNSGKTILEFQVKEYTVINSISMSGNTVFSKDQLINLYVPGQNDVFNIKRAEDFIKDIQDNYNQMGFSIAQLVECKLNPEKQELQVTIDEGRIDGIQLIGNERTQPHVIKREMPLKTGDIFDIEKVQRGINNIYGTDLFQRVHPTIVRKDGKLILQINLEEKKYEMVRVGARYDLDRETKGFIELADDNLGGLGMKSLFHARFGSRQEDYRYQFRLDRIFISYLTLNGNLHYTTQTDFLTDQNNKFKRRGDFKDTRIGASFSFGRQLGRFGKVSVKYSFDRIKVEAFPFQTLSTSESGFFHEKVNENIEIGTLTLQSVVDTRDKTPFPSQGNFHEIYYETAGNIFGSDISYVKFFSSLGYVYTFKNTHTFETRVTVGTADETLPYSKRFRWGGMQTFFGKGLNDLHGRMLVASNFGYRLKLPLPNLFETYVSIRWDLASVVEKYQNIQFSDFNHAIGIVISMNLPVGPIEFGYGKAFNDSDRIYFSLGHIF